MKLHFFFGLLMVSALLSLTACGDNKGDTTTEETTGVGENPEMTVQPDGQPAMTTAAPTATGDPAFHYICPKGCAGGGGASQGTCPVCGGELVHNQAFHNQQSPGASPENAIQVNPTTQTPGATINPPSAQNAAGVYHYTCPSGCEGGAGAAGPCAKCGATLVHNQAYHNN